MVSNGQSRQLLSHFSTHWMPQLLTGSSERHGHPLKRLHFYPFPDASFSKRRKLNSKEPIYKHIPFKCKTRGKTPRREPNVKTLNKEQILTHWTLVSWPAIWPQSNSTSLLHSECRALCSAASLPQAVGVGLFNMGFYCQQQWF